MKSVDKYSLSEECRSLWSPTKYQNLLKVFSIAKFNKLKLDVVNNRVNEQQNIAMNSWC